MVKRGKGRPTKYDKQYDEQVEKLCKLGATDKDLADFFNVSESTINLWKLKNTNFSESIKRGKVIADIEVAECLFKRATGYEHDDEEIKVVSMGNNMGSEVQRIEVVKKYAPDPTSMIFWLKNRNPEKWRDRQETAIMNPDGSDILSKGITVKFVKPENKDA